MNQDPYQTPIRNRNPPACPDAPIRSRRRLHDADPDRMITTLSSLILGAAFANNNNLEESFPNFMQLLSETAQSGQVLNPIDPSNEIVFDTDDVSDDDDPMMMVRRNFDSWYNLDNGAIVDFGSESDPCDPVVDNNNNNNDDDDDDDYEEQLQSSCKPIQ